MKKLLFLCLLLSSCVNINDTGIVEEVKVLPPQFDKKYKISVADCNRRADNVNIYTNTLYQVGDTIKIVKK